MSKSARSRKSSPAAPRPCSAIPRGWAITSPSRPRSTSSVSTGTTSRRAASTTVTGAGYFDMGYMANHIGPPESALEAFRDASTSGHRSSIYPPDCLPELKQLVAEKKFGRSLGAGLRRHGCRRRPGRHRLHLSDLPRSEGDEVIVTDPGYFHFVPAAETVRGTDRPDRAECGERLQAAAPSRSRRRSRERTKMIVVCDPINPFGTVQTRDELLAIADIARRRNIVIFNNVTHNTHQTDPTATQIPMASLHPAEHADGPCRLGQRHVEGLRHAGHSRRLHGGASGPAARRLPDQDGDHQDPHQLSGSVRGARGDAGRGRMSRPAPKSSAATTPISRRRLRARRVSRSRSSPPTASA